jgi:hypothetical protein
MRRGCGVNTDTDDAFVAYEGIRLTVLHHRTQGTTELVGK